MLWKFLEKWAQGALATGVAAFVANHQGYGISLQDGAIIVSIGGLVNGLRNYLKYQKWVPSVLKSLLL